MDRRSFIATGTAAVAGLSLQNLTASAAAKNPLPRWRGFNALDFFSPDPARGRRRTTGENFQWMSDWGFDFVRVPIAYPWYLDIDRSRNITAEETYRINERAVDEIEQLVSLAHRHNLHVSLNLHRAPGYCINAGFHEPFNLWRDQAAQDSFNFHWSMWARRFKAVSPSKISFDLVNEPSMREDMNDQHSKATTIPGELYRKVAAGAVAAIRQAKPDALIIADGNNVGNTVVPELTELKIAQSCRGYYPHAISHYKAPWANKNPDALPEPRWPGKVGDQDLSRKMLEEYYAPWIRLAESGTGVHCGECGCWNKTPHDVFLAWFSDVLDILKQNGIGFGIWEFAGDFGVLNSGRADVAYEDFHGYKLDRKFLNLLMRS